MRTTGAAPAENHVHGLDVIRVAVIASEPLREAGVVSSLRASHELILQPFSPDGDIEVIVAESPRLAGGMLRQLQRVHRSQGSATVAIVQSRGDADIQGSVNAGVAEVLHPSEASPERLLAAVRRARRTAARPAPASVAALTEQLGRLDDAAHADSAGPELSERELILLRHLAEGLGTRQIGAVMNISERTAKYILWCVMQRFSLHNRVQAVAFAIRAGLI
ncbi:LuxR C-terminal-related transcriptional regulator [Actinoplanes sp. NPDC051470]|uniref:helix-turn-helix transcriptional regulator n=1 Tax=Actinoplanes sp. NPDC051470 TaxID=3157224 RepID=UPI0034199EED